MSPQRNTGQGAEAELPEYAGHYRLESRLGSGGMGVVHLARSTSGMKVAVKVVHADYARDPEFRGRFRQEVAAARRVSGAFTAPVVDADPDAERPWMATLFIPGSTLAEQVKRNGPMSSGELRRLMAGLAEALRDIHRVGVVHRDLKPSNVLLAEDGPKVIDFGISRPKDSELRTETGKLIGTPPFMAPEQFRRPREVGPAADIFALGSVMVHAATGRGPFDSDSPYVVAYQVVHDEPDLTGVPGNLAPLVVRCLAKEPEDRPTPDELMRELRSVAASYDTQAFIPEPRAEGVATGAGVGAGPPRGVAADTADGADKAAGAAGAGGAGGSASRAERADASGSFASGEQGGATPGDPAGKPSRRTAGPRGPRRAMRRTAVGAGVLGLLAGGTLASVQLLGDRSTPHESTPRTTTAAFDAWDTPSVSTTQSTPQCSYGAGELLCGQTGVVFALDPTDGTLLWKHSVSDALRSGPPVLAGELVQPLTDPDRRLEALAPKTGKVSWRRDMPEHTGLRVVGGTLLFSAADGTVTAVDGATGGTKWRHAVTDRGVPYFSSFAGDPLAYATNVSDTGTTEVTAVDPDSGQVRWSARLEGSLGAVGSHDGKVFFLSADRATPDTEAVVRYDPASRATRRVALPVPRQSPEATVQGDVVYLMSTAGALEAVDTAAGKRLWSLETGLFRGSRPAVGDGHVYVTGADGRLLGVDARTGRMLGQTRARLGRHSDRVASSLPAPLPVDGRVYATAPDGSVFAVDGRDPGNW
ncbi:serine/threonine-protein kinase [Streptomyces sp. NBC_00582]|uniref:serine/threonine-protein kinase n=1 Tax=Streptomyces sp. NBC_00582 TaxID=2975783 RepID=UPI002E80B43D|nr:serine/threonine-protein kinase [Streptomyces sp. NBC_00582]WUB62705.1 serine/threonine-protein kinase [Streptomyces sp. NBC_00582]